MAKQSFFPRGQTQFLSWHNNFNSQLPALATKYALTTAQTDQVAADNTAVDTDINDANTQKQTAKAANTKKINTIGAAKLNAGALAKQIKAHPAYDEVDGQTLGIIGPEDSTDPTTAKPVLTLATVIPGAVGINWVKDVFDGIRIESKRGSETVFAYLATDTQPAYTDTRPNLVAGQPETREYRAQFLDGDDPVGQLSDVLSVSVPG